MASSGTLDRTALMQGLSGDLLELILLPTEQCNFRCTYCYEAFEIGKMSHQIQEAVCRLIERRSGLRHLHLSWFGGEPLAAFDVVKFIGAFAHEHCNRNNIRLSGSMTTNGFLLNKKRTLTLLRQNVEHYQVSLDGDRDAHNRTRIRANGQGSFDRILKNIEDMIKINRKFRITLRIHYHRENVESIPKLIKLLGQNFGGDSRIELFFKSVSRLGGPNDATFPVLEGAKSRNDIESIFRAQARKWFSSSEIMQLDNEKYVCYACKANSLVIRANGAIQKCTVALYDDRNTIGRLNEDGTLAVDQQKFRAWIKPLYFGSDTERGCPAKTVLWN